MLTINSVKCTSQLLLGLGLLFFTLGCSDGSDRAVPIIAPPVPVPVPPPPLLERYELSSSDSVPEGIAYDPQQRVFYATSLQGGSITQVAADGSEKEFRAADNRALLLGAKVDAQARRLWVCARGVDGIDNRVWVFDLDSGEQRMEFLLAALATNGSCNDLALDASGIAYVTDSDNPNIYRLDPETEMGSILISDPLLEDSFGVGLGSNGIAVSEDQTTLIVGKFLPAQLIAISLPDANSIGVITLAGDELPSPDGMVFIDDTLYTVSDSSVSRIAFGAGFDSATVVTVAQPSGLSTATVAEGSLYVIKSEVVNFITGRPLDTPFAIFKVDMNLFE